MPTKGYTQTFCISWILQYFVISMHRLSSPGRIINPSSAEGQGTSDCWDCIGDTCSGVWITVSLSTLGQVCFDHFSKLCLRNGCEREIFIYIYKYVYVFNKYIHINISYPVHWLLRDTTWLQSTSNSIPNIHFAKFDFKISIDWPEEIEWSIIPHDDFFCCRYS